jgi:hypothetical protein
MEDTMAFYNGMKKDAVRDLENSVKRYNEENGKVTSLAEELFSIRSNDCQRILTLVESFVNSMANTPKEFDKEFALYKASVAKFDELIQEFHKASANAEIQSGAGVGAGVLVGVGTAALMPTAALAIATAFGTASTGTAIAALSGAAATNAALAWLGGGALAAGGGGIAAGNALLALAGPIGLGIGAVGFIGGGLLLTSKNKKIAKEAYDTRARIETSIRTLSVAVVEIGEILSLTKQHIQGTESILLSIQAVAPSDYNEYSDAQKQMLGALINHIQSLTKLMNKKVS